MGIVIPFMCGKRFGKGNLVLYEIPFAFRFEQHSEWTLRYVLIKLFFSWFLYEANSLILSLFNICKTQILWHVASELNLNMCSGGYVKVNDLLKLNLKTFANFPLRLHSIDNIREVIYFDICFLLCFNGLNCTNRLDRLDRIYLHAENY